MPLYWIDNPILRHFFVCNKLKISIFISRIIIGFGEGAVRDLPVRICRGLMIIKIYVDDS